MARITSAIVLKIVVFYYNFVFRKDLMNFPAISSESSMLRLLSVGLSDLINVVRGRGSRFRRIQYYTFKQMLLRNFETHIVNKKNCKKYVLFTYERMKVRTDAMKSYID